MKFFITLLALIAASTQAIAQSSETTRPRPVLQEMVNERITVKEITLPSAVVLQYAEQGDKDGIPVILLHGFTDSWHSYEMLLSFLPSSFHVFAISQRGHGNSSKPVSTYAPIDFANDIAGFIHELKLESAVIVGHSMGSTNAQCLAVSYPSLVKKLVLVSSFADYNKPEIAEFRKLINDLSDPVDSALIASFQMSTLTKPIAPEMLDKFISESRKLSAFVWKGVAAGWDSGNFCEALQKFNKPALIIWGDKDSYCSRNDQDRLLKAIKNSKLVVYNGLGHAPLWEDPARLAADLIQFINE